MQISQKEVFAAMAIKKTGLNTLKLTQTAILSAVIIMMAFVPFLGYIRLGPLSATTLVIPVAIGAAVIGLISAEASSEPQATSSASVLIPSEPP